MSLATADAEGLPDVRTLLLHDADERGFHFASHATSAKGHQLAVRPHAALGFYWPAQGRQVRVRGPVVRCTPAESHADLHARSTGALAAALTGAQSEVVGSVAELHRAADAAWDRARAEPDTEAPTWTRYVVELTEVEFFQGDARRRRHPAALPASGGRRLDARAALAVTGAGGPRAVPHRIGACSTFIRFSP